MDVIFRGFQSTLPFWLYLLMFAGTTFLSWWVYSGVSGIRKSVTYILVTLRSAVFFILLLLLLNPFLETENIHYEKPHILVMLDNSASTVIQKSAYQGEKSYRNVLNELNFADSSSVAFDIFTMGNITQKDLLENLSMDADQTNLSEAMYTIRGNQTEARAAIFISDGIYTKDQNPVFETNNITIPIFTVGLGDTTFQKDLLVSSISTNSTGYLNSTQPVTATVNSKGFEGESFQVQLIKDGKSVDSQTVTSDISNSTKEITFDFSLNEEGLQQYKIAIPPLEEEWTSANNTQFFSVDVIDSKQQILSLALEIHPDVKFLRSLLLGDQNTTLTPRTWLNGNRFVEGTFSTAPDTFDLAVIHGYPPSGLPEDIQNVVADLAEQVPIIVAGTPLFDPQQFEQEISTLPVSVAGSWNYAPVGIYSSVDTTAHPIMELPAVTYDRLPSLFAPVKNIEESPGTTTLFSSRFQGKETQKPVLIVQEIGNERNALFTAYGWFRFNQTNNPAIRNFARQLWLNTISWAVTDPGDKKLNVEPAQPSFTGSEAVLLNAYLKNERGVLESDATIDIRISADSTDANFYSMENNGAGRYQLDLGPMPEGLYSFEATAKKGDRTIDSQKGEFAVARSNAEFLNTSRNDQLLRQLAQRTGGTYQPYDSITGFWNQLDQRGLLHQQEKVESTFFYPYQHLAWFLVVLILLCSEWILRKYYSLP